MKNFKLFPLVLITLLLCSSFRANAQSQISDPIQIEELKEFRTEIIHTIKDFTLDYTTSELDDPDYRLAQKVFLYYLKSKPQVMTNFLVRVQNDVKEDYGMLMSIRKLGNDPAIQKTEKEAKERFKHAVSLQEPEYHTTIISILFDGANEAIGVCRTVLCGNKILLDVKHWISTAHRINHDLRIMEGKLTKIDAGARIKTYRKWSFPSDLPLALRTSTPEWQHLSDPTITAEEVIQFGIVNLEKFGVDQARKKARELDHFREIINHFASSYELVSLLESEQNPSKCRLTYVGGTFFMDVITEDDSYSTCSDSIEQIKRTFVTKCLKFTLNN